MEYYFQSKYKAGRLFKTGHRDIAFTCLTYTIFNHPSSYEHLGCLALDSDSNHGRYTVNSQIEFGKQVLKDYVFLDYAICNWFYHFKEISDDRYLELLATSILLNENSSACISRNLRS
ncbi:Protein of unknown function [Pyronema omphalodes CBS 100304]|uniref:Uncharacterized protein n=1 Tax=Pyronema omphalodes (strain CBS 100304) TaxID=1076935 RepID=U4LEK4_PYROM|nr:Protein of unknown function [Pyronema omphalodes CBS 100304]